MAKKLFLHELSDFQELIAQQSVARKILPQLLEKDYWLMHCIWGLKEQGFLFELKGGTSLSKGFQIIDRFSEDIDIRIEPPAELGLKTGKNHDKPSHVESRLKFYDWLAEKISIPGITAERDKTFDDERGRNGGIRLNFKTTSPRLEGVKSFVLLEVGFDLTTPNAPVTMSSWLLDAALSASIEVFDNKARDIPCYLAEYTLVDKLDAISRKYLQERDGKQMPVNFIRHYYDVHKLLEVKSVQEFIGTKEYQDQKTLRFTGVIGPLKGNDAFLLRDPVTRAKYAEEYTRTAPLYYGKFPSFDEILSSIGQHLERL